MAAAQMSLQAVNAFRGLARVLKTIYTNKPRLQRDVETLLKQLPRLQPKLGKMGECLLELLLSVPFIK